MNKKHWFNWFDRVRFSFIVACAALILGAIYPWYRIPPLMMEAFNIDPPIVSNIGKVLAALSAGLGFWFIWQQRRSRTNKRVLRILFWCSLFITLLFPYAITTWYPKIAFVAINSFSQQTNIIVDVESQFPEVQAEWKQNISLASPLEPKSTFSLQIPDSKFFQLASWDQFLVYGLGYSPSFFMLIGHGWSMTIIGLCISLIALYLSIVENQIQIFLKDISLVLPWGGLIILAIFVSTIFFNITDYQLNALFAKGEYQKVLEISQDIEAWYPPLSGDKEFLKRKGKASFYARSPDLSLINFAQGLAYLDLNDYLNAELFFQKSLEFQPNNFLSKAYLNASILNQGVNAFNNRKPSSAIAFFEKSLEVLPGNLEGLYDLMIATTVSGSFEKSALVAKMIINNQKYFQLPSLSLLGQAYVHLTWDSYRDGDLNKAWKQYRQSTDIKAWEK